MLVSLPFSYPWSAAAMTYSKEQIVADFKAHIQKSGAQYWREWYVGISKDATNRDSVNENGDWWIFRHAGSSVVAREIESHFVNSLGTDGGTGGGDIRRGVRVQEGFSYQSLSRLPE
jgi:hypothetical protein